MCNIHISTLSNHELNFLSLFVYKQSFNIYPNSEIKLLSLWAAALIDHLF